MSARHTVIKRISSIHHIQSFLRLSLSDRLFRRLRLYVIRIVRELGESRTNQKASVFRLPGKKTLPKVTMSFAILKRVGRVVGHGGDQSRA